MKVTLENNCASSTRMSVKSCSGILGPKGRGKAQTTMNGFDHASSRESVVVSPIVSITSNI